MVVGFLMWLLGARVFPGLFLSFIMKSTIRLLLALALVSMIAGACQNSKNQISELIPTPAISQVLKGSFQIDSVCSIQSDWDMQNTRELIPRIKDIPLFQECTLILKSAEDRIEKPIIRLKKSDEMAKSEGFVLNISTKQILIEAGDLSGIKNGINTLNQLCLLSPEEKKKVQSIHIEDSPKFAWRGLMLDCSRTFIPLGEITKIIRAMSVYKLNRLHLHLTDDQGWRIEILSHPKLVSTCSQSHPRYSNESGGYYSQQEMKELIAYAAARNITIVPEIEMPGHSSEVFAAIPGLSCQGLETEIFPFFSGPGITPDILCAGKEEVFAFLEDVLLEICDLFPSEYIHIGGDEAPKIRWENCSDCQARMKEEELANTHELQSYFIRRVEKIINKQGKKLMGWDEILEGGLAENAAVMSWRGTQGGIEAAKMGHPVVMSPTSHCYFDYSYKTTPNEQVFSFNPIPEGMDEADTKHILGGQANFWTHIDRYPTAMERQIFPRIMALSEKLWAGNTSDYGSFEAKLEYHYPLLESLQIAYYHPDKIFHSEDSTCVINRLKLEAYSFDFHGFPGAEFNYQGMACKIVMPHVVANGQPWVWRARFWGHEPQFDLALLEQGFHVVYCEVGNLFGNPVAVDRWNRFYGLLQRGGLSPKPVLEGMSRGGLIVYNWAIANPEKVSCIYADAPVLSGFSWPGGFGKGKGSPSDWERFKRAYGINTIQDSLRFKGDPLSQVDKVAKLGIPLIHVCGEADDVVPFDENTGLFEIRLKSLGAPITVIRKPGIGHHPHSLVDPKVLVDFVLEKYR